MVPRQVPKTLSYLPFLAGHSVHGSEQVCWDRGPRGEFQCPGVHPAAGVSLPIQGHCPAAVPWGGHC